MSFGLSGLPEGWPERLEKVNWDLSLAESTPDTDRDSDDPWAVYGISREADLPPWSTNKLGAQIANALTSGKGAPFPALSDVKVDVLATTVEEKGGMKPPEGAAPLAMVVEVPSFVRAKGNADVALITHAPSWHALQQAGDRVGLVEVVVYGLAEIDPDTLKKVSRPATDPLGYVKVFGPRSLGTRSMASALAEHMGYRRETARRESDAAEAERAVEEKLSSAGA